MEQYIKKLKYDITVKGIIKEVLPDNKYKVGILGSEYTIPCERAFKKNESVYVLIPQNNYNEMLILSSESRHIISNQITIGDISNLKNKLNSLSNDIAEIKQKLSNLNLN